MDDGMSEPASRTEERYCYLCFGVTETEVTTYRAYVLAECMACHKCQIEQC